MWVKQRRVSQQLSVKPDLLMVRGFYLFAVLGWMVPVVMLIDGRFETGKQNGAGSSRVVTLANDPVEFLFCVALMVAFAYFMTVLAGFLCDCRRKALASLPSETGFDTASNPEPVAISTEATHSIVAEAEHTSVEERIERS